MAGKGTGHPLTLRCAKCKGVDNGRGYRLEATGQFRLLRAHEKRGGPRMIPYRVQYRCIECGHVGWSRHADAERLFHRRHNVRQSIRAS